MKQETSIITSEKNLLTNLNLRQLIKYKDLMRELVTRDLKVRYKQTVVGVLWTIIQPLLSTVIFTLFFGRIVNITGTGLPYPVFVFVGLMFWNFFSNSLTAASGSLVGNESLIKKVYFPRLIVPLSAVVTSLFDFLVTLIFLFIFLYFYKVIPNWNLIPAIFLGLLVTLTASLGSGFFLAALNVKYRDVKHVLPFFIQMLIFITPVIYPVGIFSEKNQWIMSLNPLSSAIDLVRKSFYYNSSVDPLNLAISITVSILLLFVGVYYFAKTQKSFADIL